MATLMENWNARHLARYTEEVKRGEHDHACEQRERFSLCHCSKRTREREGKTDLPEIWFHPPTCGGCDRSLMFDDGWHCETCKVLWGEHATDGDAAEAFTDDYGPEPLGAEQFGERLLHLVVREG